MLLLLCSGVNAQNLDSLYSIIEGDEADSTRIKTMLFTSQLLQNEEGNEAEFLANNASVLAVQSQEFTLAAKSFNQLGLLSYFSGDFKSCKGYFEETMYYYELAENPLGIASAGNNLGVIEYEQGFYYNALNYFAESLVIRKSFNDSSSISVSYNNIGNVYKDLGQPFKAKEFYEKSIDLKLILEDDYGLAMTYNNLGQVFHELEAYDKAIEFYEKSIKIKEEVNDRYGLGMSYANLGNSLVQKGELESAEENILKSIELRKEMEDDFGLMHSELSLAQLFILKEELPQAKQIFYKTLKTAKNQEAFVQEKDSYFGLFEIYELEDDFEQALHFHKLYSNLNDSINSAENLKVAKQVEAELGLADKDEQISELTTLVKNQKPFWKESWFEFLIFFIVIGVFMLITFIYIRDKSEASDVNDRSVKALNTIRILFFAAAFSAPVLGYFRSLGEDSIFDPFWLRCTISVLVLIPLFASYFIQRFKAHMHSIALGYFFGITAVLFYFLFKNNISYSYFIDVLIVAAAAPVVFSKLKHFLIFAVFYIALAISSYFLSGETIISFATYFISIFISLGVVFLTFLAKLNSIKQLGLSDEIVNEVDALVFIADANGNTIYASNSVKKMLGYTSKEAIEPSWYQAVGFTPEEVKELRRDLANVAIGSQEPVDSEFQPFITKDGGVKWILWKNKRIEGNRVLGIGQDVTDRKDVLDELKASEAKFRRINETLSDVFYLYNIDAKKYEYISPACKLVLGETADFFYAGKSHKAKYVHKEDFPIVEEANAKVDAGQSYEIEYRIIVNKETRWINEKSFPILDDYGNVTRNSGVCQDITAFKKSQEELEKLSLVASNTTNYILIAHVENGIEWVNESFLDTFEYTENEVLGKFPSEVLHNEGNRVASLIDEIVFKRGEKFSGEITHFTKSKEKIFAKVDVIPLKNKNGQVEKYFVLGVNLSDQKEQEELIGNALKELNTKEKALKESELNFRHLIKSIKQVFWLSDFKTKKVLFVSDSYQNVFGYSGETLVNDPKSWSTPIHLDDKERVVNAFSEFGAEGKFDEVYRVVVDKQVKWVHSRTFKVLNDEEEVIMLSGITEDVTEKMLRDIELQNLTNRLGVIHEIENTILSSESSDDIIYNTLNKTLEVLPILRSSLALFNYDESTFYSYTAKEDNEASLTDKRVFELKDFGALDELNQKKKHLITNLATKKNKSLTDEILIKEGVTLCLMSPLVYGNQLIGSFNVCFKTGVENEDSLEEYISVTNEVAQGLALAIQQSKLKEEIDLKNKDITSSINYAKMIQDAHIPVDLNHNNLLPNHFIYFKPKDIVNGDFYWTDQIGDDLILIVGDCTGHGVPGGFMTVIGIGLIQNIVSNEGEVEPGEILNKLNARIKDSLSSKREVQIQDGMDVSVCVINFRNRTFKYAGAKRPLVCLLDGELTVVSGDKYSIGSAYDNSVFETKVVNLKKSNQFYMFSDGYTDQFGGPDHRKFNRSRTFELIESFKGADMNEQRNFVEQAHEEWKGNKQQTDDIVFVGFDISF